MATIDRTYLKFRRSSSNISSRLDRVIAADEQQQFVVSSAVSSLFIITDIMARVAPRARCALLVLIMHIVNL